MRLGQECPEYGGTGDFNQQILLSTSTGPLPHPSSPSPSRSSACIKILLNCCKTLRSLEQVHAQIIHKGLEHDTTLISRFISLCITTTASSTAISYADAIFCLVSCPTLVLWNTLLKGHCRHSSLSLSLSLFSRMRLHGATPDAYTFPPLIQRCVKESEGLIGRGIHGLAVKNGVKSSVHVGSCLIDMYGKFDDVENARYVFSEMSYRNEVSWTSMIVVYSNLGRLGDARMVFDEMIGETRSGLGITPWGYPEAWNAMLGAYMKFGDLISARKLFDEMPVKDVVSYTAMVDGYGKSGDMASARFLFEQCQRKDVFLWSALISGYVQNGQPNEAVNTFMEMRETNVRPDEHIMVSLMSACSRLGQLEVAKWVDSYMSRGSFNLRNTHVVAALIDMNAKCGNMERALCLFNNIPKRDLVLYCSMIQGLSAHGQSSKAVELFYQMLNEGVAPDDIAFTVILNACSRQGLVEDGYRLFELMRNKCRVVPSPNHYSCMVDLLGRSGQLRAAFDIMMSMPVEPHVEAWGALLGACKLYCANEFGEEVAACLMKIEPCNAGNYVLLSNIYAAADRWMDVTVLRNQMVAHGLKVIPGRSWA